MTFNPVMLIIIVAFLAVPYGGIYIIVRRAKGRKS